jgi:glycine/D-amino acid oxidase-like deaminating enzyme
MNNYDSIVIGGGITGSALSYELAQQKIKVLLLEKDVIPNNATLYSYGGLAYWSGTTLLTRKLCQEGINIHRNLSAELDADTEFREIDLMLTINVADDPQTVANNYNRFAIIPQLLSVEEGYEIEPLLNPNAISGVLKLPHGHIHTQKTNKAYQQAFQRLGGEIKYQSVTKLLKQGNQIQGIETTTNTYYADQTVICAGGLSRSLLQAASIPVNLYFTHAQLILTPPQDVKLRTLVMPAIQNRFFLEQKASQPDLFPLWNQPSSDLVMGVMDAGAIQFLDGSFCLGQISEIRTDPHAKIEPISSENQIRKAVSNILPPIGHLPGTWHSCLVAFTDNSLPLVGKIADFSGVYLFSGFTSPLVFAPPLARHFAAWIVTGTDKIISQLHQS